MQVYVIGEQGILEELDLKSIAHLGGPEDATKVVKLAKGEYMEHDPDVSPDPSTLRLLGVGAWRRGTGQGLGRAIPQMLLTGHIHCCT